MSFKIRFRSVFAAVVVAVSLNVVNAFGDELPNASVVSQQIPGWLAPTVVVAIAGAIFNLLFNVVNFLRTNKTRRQDIAGARFEADVVGPLQGALEKLDQLALAMRGIRHRFEARPDEQVNRAERSQLCKEAQLNDGNAAIDSLTIALERAEQHCPSSTGHDWVDLIDGTDDLLGAFDTLSRDDVPLVRVQEAFNDIGTATTSVVASVRMRANDQKEWVLGVHRDQRWHVRLKNFLKS